ncbi:glutaredoxin-C9-like [Sesamum indicum]|uniref:Glutaredoxin-C9-like n=1 Tax=Sesamum indicum TaxID=4182 RepID=A0A6I9TQ67_SESIN|nr:glutaredoxin-C9-like [Sesamum indicum]
MQLIKKDLSSSPISAEGCEEPPAVADIEAMYEKVRVIVSGNAVVVLTISGCCMCHVVKQLLLGLGVGPTIVELDRDSSGADLQAFLFRLSGQRQPALPAVFVGGRFLGGTETVLACHINGTLVPLLKDVGALWL